MFVDAHGIGGLEGLTARKGDKIDQELYRPLENVDMNAAISLWRLPDYDRTVRPCASRTARPERQNSPVSKAIAPQQRTGEVGNRCGPAAAGSDAEIRGNAWGKH